jgi:N-acetylglucosaminyl-diphospho-decaprenol L-rhamnosyltransferase
MENTLISIVTVGMNHLNHMKGLLYSLYIEHRPSMNFEMIYVDNCSHDGTVSFIKDEYPQVKIIENQTIKGFAYNNNLGVSYALGNFIAIINPDIILTKNCLTILVETLKENTNIGIAVPRLYNTDGTIQKSIRRFINIPL